MEFDQVRRANSHTIVPRYVHLIHYIASDTGKAVLGEKVPELLPLPRSVQDLALAPVAALVLEMQLAASYRLDVLYAAAAAARRWGNGVPPAAHGEEEEEMK